MRSLGELHKERRDSFMLKRLSSALLGSAVLVTAGVAISTAYAKPPDLPVDIKETCKTEETCPGVPPTSNSPMPVIKDASILAPFSAEDWGWTTPCKPMPEPTAPSPALPQPGDELSSWIDSFRDTVIPKLQDLAAGVWDSIGECVPDCSSALEPVVTWIGTRVMGVETAEMPSEPAAVYIAANKARLASEEEADNSCNSFRNGCFDSCPALSNHALAAEGTYCPDNAKPTEPTAAKAPTRETHVFQIKHVQAIDIANTLIDYFSKKRFVCPTASTPAWIEFEKDIRISAEPVSNKLIVSVAPKYLETVAVLVQELDNVESHSSIKTAPEDYGVESAKHFCEIAKECEAKGDLAMARNCYDEAIRMAGESEFGMQAKMALAAIERVGVSDEGDAEECEPPAETMPTTHSVREAQWFYRLGLHFEKAGDEQKALKFYQKSFDACPNCEWGTKAKVRMSELEEIEPE
jgi:tetratricopeptide (TPR) repeat protein